MTSRARSVLGESSTIRRVDICIGPSWDTVSVPLSLHAAVFQAVLTTHTTYCVGEGCQPRCTKGSPHMGQRPEVSASRQGRAAWLASILHRSGSRVPAQGMFPPPWGALLG